MGLGFVVASDDRLPQLNAVSIPVGMDEAAVRKRLLQDCNLEIGAGLGSLAGEVWRVGLLGQAANRTNVLLCLTALSSTLQSMAAAVTPEAAIGAAQVVYAT